MTAAPASASPKDDCHAKYTYTQMKLNCENSRTKTPVIVISAYVNTLSNAPYLRVYINSGNIEKTLSFEIVIYIVPKRLLTASQ